MKRSKINYLIRESIDFFHSMNFFLPPWGYWTAQNWMEQPSKNLYEIINTMLGWDITENGKDMFETNGLILFTLRNGKPGINGKPYAEKIMIVGEGQECRMHFHWRKMEDIINRGGGNLVFELYQSTEHGSFSSSPCKVKIDGIERSVALDEKLILTPGESICIEQGIYHKFYGEAGKGRVLTGEISSVNDDYNDNRFYDIRQERFLEIEEDTEPEYLMAIDYKKHLNF